MRNYSRVGFWRFTQACTLVLAVGIILLSIWLLSIRRQFADASTASVSQEMDSISQDKTTHPQATVQKICFLRGSWIYLMNLTSGEEVRLVEGLSPHLSPTGESVVFVSVKENEGIMNRVFPPSGRLRLLDLRTKGISDFKATHDRRVGDAIWSNGGLRIAFTMSSNERKVSSIGIINPDTGDLEKEILGPGIPLDDAIYLDSWTPDDRSLLFHTLGALYEVHIDDGRVEKVPVDEIFKSGAVSSATQFYFSSDRLYLLFDTIIDTSSEPVTDVIFLFDFPTKTLRRVTPKGISGRAALWLPSNKEILFSRVEWRGDKWRSDVCKMALDGTGLTTVARDADFVSYATR